MKELAVLSHTCGGCTSFFLLILRGLQCAVCTVCGLTA